MYIYTLERERERRKDSTYVLSGQHMVLVQAKLVVPLTTNANVDEKYIWLLDPILFNTLYPLYKWKSLEFNWNHNHQPSKNICGTPVQTSTT